MDNAPNFPAAHLRPWTLLNGVDDAEVWVANSNLELNYFLEQDRNAGMPVGQGICFNLSLGGDVYLHTTSEGMILLDVTEEADWVRPILCKTGQGPNLGIARKYADPVDSRFEQPDCIVKYRHAP